MGYRSAGSYASGAYESRAESYFRIGHTSIAMPPYAGNAAPSYSGRMSRDAYAGPSISHGISRDAYHPDNYISIEYRHLIGRTPAAFRTSIQELAEKFRDHITL